MRFLIVIFLGLSIGLQSNGCSSGEHWVIAHHRRAYRHANGNFVKASEVTGHCQKNPSDYADWNPKLMDGRPMSWHHDGEQSRKWTPEERERVLEALDETPDLLKEEGTKVRNPFCSSVQIVRTVLIAFSLSGAALADNSSLRLPLVETLKPGISTKSQIITLLGEPWRKTNLKDLPRSTEKGEIWEYRDTKATRFSISFRPTSEIVDSWDWAVFDKDAEQDLKGTLAKFPGAAWQVETVKWVNPHSVPNECYFLDNKQGISIEYNRARKEVTSISRWFPSRALSESDAEEKPPKFCIDGHCSNGISGKEFTKTWPLCELPK